MAAVLTLSMGRELRDLSDAAIVPQVVPDMPLQANLSVTYGKGERSTSVLLGQRLATGLTSSAPIVQCDPVPAGSPGFTLVMFDPDTPFGGNHLHWCQVNVGTPQVATIKRYVGAGPPANTGLHRYIFLLYQQTTLLGPRKTKVPGKIRFADLTLSLSLRPVAVNSMFFVARFDCSPFTCLTTTLLCTWLCCCCTPADDFVERVRRKRGET